MSASPIDNAIAPRRRPWLVFALATVALWGVWGALAGLSAEHGFPDTLVYCVWALTMIPPALYILWRNGWKLERSPRAVAYGMTIGLLGAGGQMLLFHTLTIGPAYFVFPIISLSPVVISPCPLRSCASAPAGAARWASCWRWWHCRRWTCRSAAAPAADWAGSCNRC